MKVAIATGRQAHYRLPANAFVRRGYDVCMYTSTPRNRMRDFDPLVRSCWIPAPVALFSAATHTRTPLRLDEIDSVLFDSLTALALQPCNLFCGASSSSLATGRAAKKLGATFILDRACPDIRVQQRMLAEEALKVGAPFRGNSAGFIERQVEEYEEADFILCPSDYSRRSFPAHLREKIILAPLYGRSRPAPRIQRGPGSPFVFGVVGGEPLRKGFLYLLQAWKDLALPNALLKIRTGKEIYSYPALNQLLRSMRSVEVVNYMPDIDAFYASCDGFVLSSVDDGFGMSLFEALASGLPSIATRNCGSSELLVSDRDCLLIEAFSVEQLKQAIQRIYEEKELRERLAFSGPAAIAALQEGGASLPYEQGLDRLLQAISSGRKSQSAAAA